MILQPRVEWYPNTVAGSASLARAPFGDCATRAAGWRVAALTLLNMASAVPPVEDGYAHGATKNPARLPAQASA